MKKLAAILALSMVLMGSASDESPGLVLVLSSNDPRLAMVAGGFRQAFPGTFREINLEGNDKKLRDVGEELQASKPELAVVVGNQAAQMAKWYLEDVPVVYCEAPLAAKIFQGSTNVVAISHQSDPMDQLKALQTVFPDKKRVGLFYGKQYTRIDPEKISEESRQMGLRLRIDAMSSIKEVPPRLKELISEVDVIWVMIDPEVLYRFSIEYVVVQAISARLPVFCGDVVLGESGATAALPPNPVDVGVKAATEAQNILDKGPTRNGDDVYAPSS
jgi:ABC-type uncharacterized transport system substrate-binding protein